MRWLNPSAVLNFRKPSIALAKESETLDFDVPGELRFIRNSSIFGKMSTAVRQANEKPEPDGLWFALSSGGCFSGSSRGNKPDGHCSDGKELGFLRHKTRKLRRTFRAVDEHRRRNHHGCSAVCEQRGIRGNGLAHW